MPEVIIILPWKGLWYAGWWPSSWKGPEVSITSECQQANVRGCCVPCNWSVYRTALSWWRHQMETFSALLALCAGNSPVPVNSPHKGQWRGAWMFSLISACINAWVNNREAGDLRRHRGHYDAIVMVSHCFALSKQWPIVLTYLRLDKMSAISQMTYSNAFSWMKMYEFRLSFHWSLFPMFELTRGDNGMAPTRRQAIIWISDSQFTDAYMYFDSKMFICLSNFNSIWILLFIVSSSNVTARNLTRSFQDHFMGHVTF